MHGPRYRTAFVTGRLTIEKVAKVTCTFAIQSHELSWYQFGHPTHLILYYTDKLAIIRFTNAGVVLENIKAYMRQNSKPITTQEAYNCIAEGGWDL